MLPARDPELVQIVDRTLADATVRARRDDGGSWLACRPGCTPCCHGVFRISALDAARLRDGLRELERREPERAAAIALRRDTLVQELRPLFPGDAKTGTLDPERNGTWDSFAEQLQTDAACPVLDPATGRCELYEARPLTCRIFGPPVVQDGGLGLCELCYIGASREVMLAGEMHLEHHALEEELDRELPAVETIIAWALLPEP